MEPLDAYTDGKDAFRTPLRSFNNFKPIPTVDDWIVVLQTYIHYHKGILPDHQGRVLDSDAYPVSQERQKWVQECVGAYYVPLFYQFWENTTCDMFSCPDGTFDHDMSAATPCRRLL